MKKENNEGMTEAEKEGSIIHMNEITASMNTEFKTVSVHGVDIETFKKLKRMGVYGSSGYGTQWVDINGVTFFRGGR